MLAEEDETDLRPEDLHSAEPSLVPVVVVQEEGVEEAVGEGVEEAAHRIIYYHFRI